MLNILNLAIGTTLHCKNTLNIKICISKKHIAIPEARNFALFISKNITNIPLYKVFR